jgi:hypothetical protein
MEPVSRSFPWSCDALSGILQSLALDGASRTFQQLAYLTHNNNDLRSTAKRMRKPLVLRVGFDRDAEDKTFIFPFHQAKVAKIKIYWGDGSRDIVNKVGDGFAEHRYHGAGEFVVRVFPLDNYCSLDHIGGSLTRHSQAHWWKPLRSFESLGTLGIRSLSCLFKDATTFNLPLNHLDVSNIFDMSHAFRGALKFNQPLNFWNVSRVIHMRFMFYNCLEFNQSIVDWNVSCVSDMACMFENAASFSAALESWDVSSVRVFNRMFFDVSLVDRASILKSWNLPGPLSQHIFRPK